MSATDSQSNFNSWRQKSTHRPVLRMPVNVSSSDAASQTPTAPPGSAVQAPAQSASSTSSTTSPSATSNVSSLPIPSLDRLNVASRGSVINKQPNMPAADTAAASPAATTLPNQRKEMQREMSLTGSVSVTASEQLMVERLRVLEEERANLQRSLRERMTQAANRLADPAPAAAAASPASSGDPPYSSSSSSSSSRVMEASTVQEKCLRSCGNASSTPSVHASEDPTQQTPLSSSRTSLARGARQARMGDAAPPSAAACAAKQFSPPARNPHLGLGTTAASSPEHPPPSQLPQPQQTQPGMEPSQAQQQHQLSLRQLQHDMQHCAREIERLVEDQYDLRCTVRETLLELSNPDNSWRGASACTPTHSSSVPVPSASHTDSAQEHHEGARPAAVTASNKTHLHLAGPSADTGVDSSSPPPPWLLPWLQQLRAEQSDHFQHLREEMVVLVCHAVAEARHLSRRPDQRSSEDRANHSPLPTRQAVEAAADSPALQVVEADPRSLRHRAEHAEDPPAPLLWQRYRRLMSPTPPERSDVVSSVAPSASPSSLPASSALSVRMQDALWSAVLHMQRVVESQSAQIAYLTERVSRSDVLPVAPVYSLAQPRHHHDDGSREKHRASSVASSDAPSTSFTDATSISTPPPHQRDRRRATPRGIEGRVSSADRAHQPRHTSRADRHKEQKPRTHQLDAIQDEMSDLRHLLQETLQRDQQQQQLRAEHTRDTHARERPQQRHFEVHGSSDGSDARSSTYARRRYAETNPPPVAPGRRGADAAQGDAAADGAAPRISVRAVGHSLPTDDTRYARGVVPYHHQQQQQQQQQQRDGYTPNARSLPSQQFLPSPYVSPIHAAWQDEDVYDDAAARPAVAEARRTPAQLPRQRVRTTLTSSFVYPPS